tara:strand:+ start:139 stop:327 length:189 start_codon:yes stop_codon:yes gene_type:complete
MSTVIFLLAFIFTPFLLLVFIVVMEEKLEEKDKNIERETINTIDEDDWDSDDKVERQYSWDT